MDRYMSNNQIQTMKDYGNKPLVINIDNAAKVNKNFRTALWTGEHLQVTLMSIPVGGDIGLEMHPNTDQFIRIESGYAYVMMGKRKENLDYQRRADANYAIIIPAGTWHNIKNRLFVNSWGKVCKIALSMVEVQVVKCKYCSYIHTYADKSSSRYVGNVGKSKTYPYYPHICIWLSSLIREHM